MNRHKILCLILTVISIIMLTGCATTRKHWVEAKSSNTISAYEDFIKQHSNTVYADSAKTSIFKLNLEKDWSSAKQKNTIYSYEKFIRQYQESEYTDEAKLKLKDLYLERDWKKTQESENIDEYEKFMNEYPNSKYQSVAKDKLVDLKIWTDIKKIGTIQAYQNFIKDQPNNPYVDNAKYLIDDYNEDISGREIVEALRKNKVEIEVTGSGIEDVKLRIRRITDHPLKITLPIGTYFVCRGSSQNMVGRKEKIITLNNDEWQNFWIPAACANRSRDIPNDKESFDIQRSPNQADLIKMMPVLEKSNVSYGVEQAAVWIVTDNADYGDLGTLVQRSQFQIYGGTRVIQEYEAAMAIKICDEAGINIKTKSIWADVPMIIKGLKDNNLKRWLEQRYNR